MKTFKPTAANIALALTLIALQPAFAADATVGAAQSEAAKAEATSAERKAALEVIDTQIKHIERAVDNAPDEASKEAAKLRLKALKERRSDLRKNYAAAKADELKADTKLEYEKVAAWTRKTARDAVNPRPNAALAQIAVYRLDPSPENKTEVKAALEALDDEIDRLEDYAETLTKGPERRALEKRVKALEKREDALKRDFTKARWDSLVSDLRAEWNQIAD